MSVLIARGQRFFERRILPEARGERGGPGPGRFEDGDSAATRSGSGESDGKFMTGWW